MVFAVSSLSLTSRSLSLRFFSVSGMFTPLASSTSTTSATLETMVERKAALTWFCTAFFAWPVILGAMAFFLPFS